MKNINLFKRFILLSFFFLLQLAHAQQYPVQVTPVLIPPYSLKLSDYATTNENKLQLQLLMTDLMEPTHQVRLRFSLESGLNATPIAISNQYINGMRDITLSPGVPLILTNVELRALFQLQNLSGISATNYSKTLPQGQYNFCFEVIDSNTGRTLSRKSCSTAYFVQYDPPMLSLPQNKELVQKQNEIQNIVFQWMPRQIAPNTRYIFTMKEIWDLQRDPVTAFLASPVLWKEEVYSNSLFYGFDKTQLLPGKRYAWQIQARSGNPVLGGNPTEDNGVYKNNGLSEIFYFDYIQDCKVPSFLSAKNAGRGRVEVRWSYPGEKPNGLYRIQYRKKGTTTAWMEQEAYQEMIYISGLADKTEYEYRVGAICGLAQTYNNGYENGADNAYSYSNIQYFTTDSEDTSNTVQCGMMPDINITNKTPLQDMLVANDVFTAGDFPVTIIKSEGNGTYTGQGYIVVPYLADTKVKVSFNNIQINTDRQLISGVIETTYDPTESAVHYVSQTVDGIFGDGDVKEVNIDYPIDSVYYSATPPPGTITVVGPPGKNGENPPTQTYQGGRDTTIIDGDGNIWEVDKDGNITKGGQVAPGGASNSKNTDGVSGSGKDAVVNQYTAKGIDLTWQKAGSTKFDFDTKEQTGLPISDYETVKDRNGQAIAIPYKAVVNGQTDILQADIKITDASLKDSKIIFKTLSSGKNIEATETKISDTNRRFDLTLKGAYNYQEEDVIAVLMPNDSLAKQQVISSFKLLHLNGKKAKVHLVPLDQKSKGNLTQIRKNLSKVYDAIGVNFEIVDEDVLDISNLGIGQKIESGDPKLMSTYGSDQIKINNHYLNTRSKELRYVLFVTDKSSSTGQHGYMRLNGQFGYVFAGAPIKTAAHELGHGIFRLEHPKQNYPKLLMDNSSITGEILSHKDWKQIGDPAFKFYGFQDQSEGEHIDKEFILNEDGNFINPSGELVFLKEGTKVSFLCNEPNLNGYNGVLYGFETKDGKRWVSDIAIALNELNSSSATFKGYFQVSQASNSWAKDTKGNRILYNQDISNLKTGEQNIHFIHAVRDQDKIVYTILKQSVNITTDWLPKNKTFSGSKYKERNYNTSLGVIETITSTGCKSTPQEEKGTLVDTIKKDGYTLSIYKNETTGKFTVEVQLLGKPANATIAEQKSALEAQIKQLAEEKLNKLGGLDAKEKGFKEQTEDGGEFFVKDMNGREWMQTIGDLGESIWETAAMPKEYWNKNEGYDKANIHIPPTFAGVSDGVIDEVTSYPQLAKLAYDVSTKQEVRNGIWNSVKNISPSSVYASAESAVKNKIANYNFSDKPYLGYHEIGKDGVQVVSMAMGAGFFKKGADALEEGTKDVAKKIEKEVKKDIEKAFLNNIDNVINNLKKNAKYVLEGTGEYNVVKGHHPLAKKAFEGVENYDYKKAFSIKPSSLEDAWKTVNSGIPQNIHAKVTGNQNSLYSAWRKENPLKQMEIGEMANIEIKAMVNAGIPEDIATGWVVKGLEDMQTKGVKSIANIPWNGVN
ncbi:fibronectin type III domain-containing protein [Empedobacter tilapiae]|uniref:fibronectin type III domain-containing protein n=1 Tax=Empedobacter tilapiae TaxID=2491114 RepID=UPI0028D5F8C0|nr:fibronectin type III domain-containing protein [Empedobacter tilapiae]